MLATDAPSGADAARHHWPSLVVGLVLLLALSVSASQLITQLRAHQQMSTELAELNSVSYGLLNANVWVEHFSALIGKKIHEFDLTPERRATLKTSLERMLDTLITEADRYLRQRNAQGDNWLERFGGRMKQTLQDLFVDIRVVKEAIPTYADRILEEMEDPEARDELERFLEQILTDLSRGSFAQVDMSLIEAIQEKYGCEVRGFCRHIIELRLQESRSQALTWTAATIGLGLLLFALAIAAPSAGRRDLLGVLALSSFIWMLCGVLTPMLDVEAKITELKFFVLSEPVVFTDQVLYFQSKSVLDVVQVLTATGTADMIAVGILIMSFSVLFPVAKLAASFAYLYNPRGARANPVIVFFALKSGKWSMADVMVVAIFMAYIGFNGMIASQLSTLGAAAESAEVLTTNGTTLQIGFFMFLAFCLSALLTSTMMETMISAEEQQAAKAQDGPAPRQA